MPVLWFKALVVSADDNISNGALRSKTDQVIAEVSWFEIRQVSARYSDVRSMNIQITDHILKRSKSNHIQIVEVLMHLTMC